jgi:RimJ/RimL family protein N-acetyltransferase
MNEEQFVGGTLRLTINYISSKDLEEVRNLHNEESTISQLTDDSFVTKQMQEKWFKALSTSNKAFRFVCRQKIDASLVGVFRIDEFDKLNKSAMIGLDVAERFRRQGFANEIYECFIEFFFSKLYFHRLYLNTLENNIPARNLYEKLGFNVEGRFNQAIIRNNEFNDLICYYKINKNNKFDK